MKFEQIKVKHAEPGDRLWRLFHGQFLLGPSFADHLEGWQRIAIDDRTKLTVHPELTTAQASDKEKSLTLLGCILDPNDPVASNADILARLLPSFSSIGELIEATGRFGGRWICIAMSGEGRFLFNDALGLRQVFYTNPADTGSLWAMSQPGIAAEQLGLHLDPQATAFSESQTFRSDPEYRWPAEASPFKGLKHLLPNHWLDLDTGTSHRYWPMEPLARVEPEAAIERLSRVVARHHPGGGSTLRACAIDHCRHRQSSGAGGRPGYQGQAFLCHRAAREHACRSCRSFDSKENSQPSRIATRGDMRSREHDARLQPGIQALRLLCA